MSLPNKEWKDRPSMEEEMVPAAVADVFGSLVIDDVFVVCCQVEHFKDMATK
jgi:hypothetical protein